ncbi:MAG: outer membrane protein assembly factor BamA [Bacteroidia bacterium]|jgi:outer membrane protein assembly factor BamA
MKNVLCFLLVLYSFHFEILAQTEKSNHLVSISSVEISGNIKTKDAVVLRELRFKEGGSYPKAHLEEVLIPQSENNLKNLNLFNQIEIIQIEADRSISIKIEVIEKWYFWPIPFVEFSDRNFNQWWNLDFDPSRTNIGIYLFKYNAFGLNHQIKASFSTGYTKALGLNYEIPWLGKRKVYGLSAGFSQKKNEEVWLKTEDNRVQFFAQNGQFSQTKTSGFIDLRIRPKTNFEQHVFALFNDYKVADTVLHSSNNPNYLKGFGNKQQELLIGYQFVIVEARNNKLLPTNGEFIQATLSSSLNNINTSSFYSFFNFEMEASWYGKPAALKKLERWSGAFAINIGSSFQNTRPYIQQRALGYSRNIRGYESYVIDGYGFVLSKAELRFHTIKPQTWNMKWVPVESYKKMPIEHFASVFIDAGKTENATFSPTNTFINRWNIGYGIGYNVLLYFDKVFRFEYSWTQYGEGGLKIHFSKAL